MILDTNERFSIVRPENLQGWLKERTNGIGASELASILGLKQVLHAAAILHEKTE